MVSLRGDTNVLILIDGRPSTQFQGSAAGENLQSLSAADIERIEVLTTPPPQFKAEGAAGVINIVTRKRRAQGASGTVQGSLGNGGRYFGSTSLSYAGRQGSVSLNAGFRQDYRDRHVDSQTIAPDPKPPSLISSTVSGSKGMRRLPSSRSCTAVRSLDG